MTAGSKVGITAATEDEFALVASNNAQYFQADSKENVSKAAEVLFDPLLKATGLTKKELIIAPGNHDMKRGVEKSIVKKAFDSAKTNAEINELCQDPDQVEMSLENFKYYISCKSVFCRNFSYYLR